MIGKLLVFVAFGVGLAAFFLPFIGATGAVTVGGERADAAISFSALQLLQGIDTAAGAVDSIPQEQLENELTIHPEFKPAFGEVVNTIRTFVAIVFAPTVLFLLIGLLGLRRFGRGLGATALIVGGLTLAGWFLISTTAESTGSSEISFGLGFTLLLVGGVLGAAGGLAGLVAPQRDRS